MSDVRMGSSNVFTSTAGIKFADGTTQITAAVTGEGNATSIQNINVSPIAPDHNGELLIYDSVTNTYVPGDPLVQGLFPEGTPTSGINPILVAGRGADGNQHSLSVDNSGALNVNAIVTLPGTMAVTGTFWQATQPVSVASLPLPTGASTETTLASIDSKTPVLVGGNIPVTGTFWQSVQPVSGPLTDAELRATPVPVDGSGVTQPVSGTFWQTTQPVSGTFWQTTQPVSVATLPLPSGAATDTNQITEIASLSSIDSKTPVLVGGSIPVTGTFWQAIQPVSGTVSVSNFPVTQPVSGTVIVDQGTSPWVVSLASTTITGSVSVTGTFWQAIQPVSGTISFTTPQHVIVDSATLGTVAVSGTFWQATQPVSGTFWQATQPVSIAAPVDVSDRAARLLGHVTVDNASIAVTGTFWQAIQPISGTITANQGTSPWVVSMTSTTITGTVAVTGTFWQATQPVSIAVMPTTPVTGTFWQAIQPVSGSISFTAPQHVIVDSATLGTVAVSGTFWQAVQPISGTVTANVGTTGGLALDATLTGGTAKFEMYDGTNVLGTTLHPVKVDGSGVTQPVSGTFWQATQPISGSVSVSNFPATRPVSGTVTALQGTSPWVVSLTSTTITGSVAVTGTFWQATQPVSIASAVDVSDRVGRLLGHVTVDNASLAVTGTFWQAVQPISGAISFTAPQHVIVDSATLGTVAVSGTFWQATQPVSIASMPSTPVTGTFWPYTLGQQLAANSVPVVLTAAQLSTLTPLSSVSITGSVAVTGTFWQATQPVSIAAPVDVSDRAARLLGHVTVDNAALAVTGTFWQAVQPVSGTVTANQGTSPWVVSLTSTTITGTVAVTQSTSPWIVAGGGTAGVPGTAVLTVQGISGGTPQPVSGTFWQATQPVSLASTTITGTVAVTQSTSPWVVSLASTTITGTVDVSDRSARLLGHVTVDNASIAVTGTFWQAIQPVSGTVTANQGTSPWIVAGGGTAGVSGTAVLTVQGIAGGTALPVSGTFWQATQPVSGAISFTAPQHVITDTTSVTNATLSAETTKVIGTVNQGTSPWVVSLASTTITGNVTVIQPTGTNLHTVIDSGTLTTVSTVTAVTAITNALPVGANTIGKVDILGNAGGILDTVKGTQSATAVGVQELKDAGRNMTNYFMAAPIITTTAEVMQSLTGYKSGAAVVATATPAVVTAGKTYRIQSVEVTYWAATVIGGARINLRANLTGVGVVGSPLVKSWQVGVPAAFVAGSASTYTFDYPDGLEFAAGTGIAIGVIGEGAVPTTGTITGYVLVAINGYEY